MSINHITHHITGDALFSEDLGELMKLLGFREIGTDDPFEHGWDVRWFGKAGQPNVHFVATPEKPGSGDVLDLGHFCVIVNSARFAAAKESPYLTRDSGSGRIWMGLDRVRIEVRQQVFREKEEKVS